MKITPTVAMFTLIAFAFLNRIRIPKPHNWLVLMLLGGLQIPTAAIGAGVGDPVPSCSASGIEYSVTNVLPSGYCFYSGANLTVGQ